MTESEWNTCADPPLLLGLLHKVYGHLSPRKLRLFACHCLRNILHTETEPEVRAAVRCLERFTNPGASEELVREAQQMSHEVWLETFGSDYVSAAVVSVASRILNQPFEAARDGTRSAAEAAHLGTGTGNREAEYALQASWLRDIFPSPYRPKRIDRDWFAWNHGTAISLARQIDQREDFSLLPILADALQDAGCDVADVLNHCRDGSLTHVRGCWVVDLVLGRA